MQSPINREPEHGSVPAQRVAAGPSFGRAFDRREFHRAFNELIVGGHFQETREYYPRYRNRYRSVLKEYATLAEPRKLDVLEVGGGQHALLAASLWGDRATVADLNGPHLETLRARGVRTANWDLLSAEQPFRGEFDRAFLCEVIAHVPTPPHTYLTRLRESLKPGGKLIVTTPNLHRLRNVVCLASGRKVFDPFALVGTGQWGGGFLDFSREHLHWQLEHAGFTGVKVAEREFGHAPTSLGARLLHWTFAPLRVIPRFRYHLLATATAP